jgi:IS30 family transposase
VALRERGWSILAAARQAGVSRTTVKNWSRGYKTYRHGRVSGFVPALERLAACDQRAVPIAGRADREDRSQAGPWEGDLIIGKDQGSAIGTLVERQTRMVRLLPMPSRDSDTLHDALTARMAGLPPVLLRSITWDQGTEMARHLTITRSLGAPVDFCDSHSPWQRGSNQNTNGLPRDYFPKGTDLSAHSPQHLLAVETELNNRPRRVLGDRPPAELFATVLASCDPPVLRR